VIDRLVLTSLESVWQAHEHGKPAPQEPASHDAHSGHEAHDEADDREITLLLLRYSTPLAAASLPRVINASERLQAASPAFESARLVSLLGVGADGLRAFGLMILAVAGLSVFVALFQTLAERRRDMALLRRAGTWRCFGCWAPRPPGCLLCCCSKAC
jgi:putative ABC transport system permease protein